MGRGERAESLGSVTLLSITAFPTHCAGGFAIRLLFHLVLMQAHPGISRAPPPPPRATRASPGQPQGFSSHWPTLSSCRASSPRPGLLSCVLLCSTGDLSQEAVTAQLEQALSAEQTRAFGISAAEILRLSLRLPQMETSVSLQKNSTFSCNPKPATH